MILYWPFFRSLNSVSMTRACSALRFTAPKYSLEAAEQHVVALGGQRFVQPLADTLAPEGVILATGVAGGCPFPVDRAA